MDTEKYPSIHDPSVAGFRASTVGGRVTIYALVDPRDDTVRYVGKTTNVSRRLKQHVESGQGTARMRAWVREVSESGATVQIERLSLETDDTWEDAERAWIGFFRARGKIYNVNNGGGGTCSASIDPRHLDPRRLARLAAAARKAGITRLRLADGTEFELGSEPEPHARPKLTPVADPQPRPDTGSLEAMRRRFGRKD